jgi:hypothetical protein
MYLTNPLPYIVGGQDLHLGSYFTIGGELAVATLISGTIIGLLVARASGEPDRGLRWFWGSVGAAACVFAGWFFILASAAVSAAVAAVAVVLWMIVVAMVMLSRPVFRLAAGSPAQ